MAPDPGGVGAINVSSLFNENFKGSSQVTLIDFKFYLQTMNLFKMTISSKIMYLYCFKSSSVMMPPNLFKSFTICLPISPLYNISEEPLWPIFFSVLANSGRLMISPFL